MLGLLKGVRLHVVLALMDLDMPTAPSAPEPVFNPSNAEVFF